MHSNSSFISRLKREQRGGITLEAAMILPVFVLFVVILHSFIQIGMAQLALQTAVAETTKQVATQLYPIDQLYHYGRAAVENSAAAQKLSDVLDTVQSVQHGWNAAEEWLDRYEAFVPDIVIALLRWEQHKKEQLTQTSQREAERIVETALKPLLHESVAVFVRRHANSPLQQANVRVTNVTIPDLDEHVNAFIGITATYTMPMPAPFIRKKIIIQKTAYERAWLGA